MNSKEILNQKAVETLWLLYFNNALFEAGLITETERNRMTYKIKS